jgi:hypothetical protein
LSSSEPSSATWKLRRPERLQAWVLEPIKHQQVSVGHPLSDAEELDARARLATAQFILEVVLKNPDFGEVLDDQTRSMTVPGTSMSVIWTFDSRLRSVEIITPFLA